MSHLFIPSLSLNVLCYQVRQQAGRISRSRKPVNPTSTSAETSVEIRRRFRVSDLPPESRNRNAASGFRSRLLLPVHRSPLEDGGILSGDKFSGLGGQPCQNFSDRNRIKEILTSIVQSRRKLIMLACSREAWLPFVPN